MRILIVFLWILTGFTTGVVASDKGHGFGSWALAGFFLGPVGLIAAAGLSDQKLREYIRRKIDPDFVDPLQSNQRLLYQSDLFLDSAPKLLKESSNDVDGDSKSFSKEKYIGDFLLNSEASENEIWIKIMEMFEFCSPDLVYLADQKRSKIMSSLSGGKAYLICDSDEKRIALAYSKLSANQQDFYWKIKIY
tara:strand:- start:1714 stop:2289 length:576 start_codon:yes stop_codon:yes gene_type:complete